MSAQIWSCSFEHIEPTEIRVNGKIARRIPELMLKVLRRVVMRQLSRLYMCGTRIPGHDESNVSQILKPLPLGTNFNAL